MPFATCIFCALNGIFNIFDRDIGDIIEINEHILLVKILRIAKEPRVTTLVMAYEKGNCLYRRNKKVNLCTVE